jgi:hypothetical protein
VGQPEGLWCREGGTLPWVVQVEGNERLLVGIGMGVWYLGLDTIFVVVRPSWLRYPFP